MFVLRHGETTWNVDGRMQGGLDSPLTPRGRAQALLQGQILRGAGALGLPVFSSPQGRALETAKLAVPDADITVDARLKEVAMGAWQGLRLDEIRRTVPDTAAEPHSFLWKFSAPGGERLEEMLVRVRAFLAEVERPAVVVTHGVTSQLMRGCLLGLDLDEIDHLSDRQGVVYHVRNGREAVLEC